MADLPDSSDIMNAIVAKLGSDGELLALCPNGVHSEEAPQGSTRFVVVTLASAIDLGVFGKTALEDGIYLIEARMLSTIEGANPKRAAQRIYELLHDQPLTVPGYAWATTHRIEYIRFREKDEIDPSIRWFRRGGQYFVQMSHPAA